MVETMDIKTEQKCWKQAMSKNNNWTTENIPDQKGRIAIITGNSSGDFFVRRIYGNEGLSGKSYPQCFD